MKSPAKSTSAKSTVDSIISVALVEDQKDLCRSWVQIIESFGGFKCTCICASAEQAVDEIPDANPDVILMDIRLPRMSGIECTSRLKELLPETPIVILTVLDDDELIFRALEAGADGYLLKRSKPADLCAALLDVLEGGAPMSSSIARRVGALVPAVRRRIHKTGHICPPAKSKCWVCCRADYQIRKSPTRCV